MKVSAVTVAVALLASADRSNAFGNHQLPFSIRVFGGAHASSSSTELSAEGSKITMPALSSTMKEGRVVSWLKSEGEAISAGEAIMVVESDKADMDVEAFEDGFLAKIIVGEGEMAPVGEPVALIAAEESEIADVIASFSSGGGSAPAAPAAPAAAASAAAPAAAGT
jgi:pyruvate dehydrogenase E2 component (dihydrolipoamide acetyltransferase)